MEFYVVSHRYKVYSATTFRLKGWERGVAAYTFAHEIAAKEYINEVNKKKRKMLFPKIHKVQIHV